MTFSTPCDACRTPLSGEVTAIRVAAFAVVSGAPAAHRLVHAGRPGDYLFCAACAETLDAYIRYVEANRGVLRSAVG